MLDRPSSAWLTPVAHGGTWVQLEAAQERELALLPVEVVCQEQALQDESSVFMCGALAGPSRAGRGQQESRGVASSRCHGSPLPHPAARLVKQPLRRGGLGADGVREVAQAAPCARPSAAAGRCAGAAGPAQHPPAAPCVAPLARRHKHQRGRQQQQGGCRSPCSGGVPAGWGAVPAGETAWGRGWI